MGRRKNKSVEGSTSRSNRCITLTMKPNCLSHYRLRVPTPFVVDNCLDNKEVTLLGPEVTKPDGAKAEGTKAQVSVKLERARRRSPRFYFGKGWNDVAKANQLQPGDSITFESIGEDTAPVLRFHIDRGSENVNVLLGDEDTVVETFEESHQEDSHERIAKLMDELKATRNSLEEVSTDRDKLKET